MDYTSILQTCSWLLSAVGQVVTLTPAGGTYNVATSSFTGNGVPVTANAVLVPLSRGLRHMPGTDIQTGDMQLLLSASVAQPPVDSLVQVNGRTYTIVEVCPVNPSGEPLYYDCIVRLPQ